MNKHSLFLNKDLFETTKGKDHLRVIPAPFMKDTIWQSFSALYWFEKLFAEHEPASVLELGALNGVLTIFFGLHAIDNVITVDLADCINPHTRELYRRLGIEWMQCDILNNQEPIKNKFRQQKRNRFIFCDNGNKEAEFISFAPLLETGDLIGVHDVGAEFFPDKEDIQKVVQQYNLERLYENELLNDGTLLAFYKKR
jgi:cephalosporin hydroxylase